MSPGSERAPVLEVRRLSMRFGAVEALRDVSFAVRDGDVLAFCGDNGAGKSTLVKVVAGVHRPTAGAVLLAGRPVDFGSPRDALDHGIATIYQDLALAPRLAIYQNVFLGSELVRPLGLPWLRIVDKAAMRRRSAGYLERLQISLADMNAPPRPPPRPAGAPDRRQGGHAPALGRLPRAAADLARGHERARQRAVGRGAPGGRHQPRAPLGGPPGHHGRADGGPRGQGA